jgi:hypothetical protein
LKAPAAPLATADPQVGTADPVAPATSASPRLTRDNVRRLQSALHELRECRRLIDQVLKDEAA